MENVYKMLLDKVNKGSACVTLTCLDYNSSIDGSISDKQLLTKEDVENKTLPLSDDLYEKILFSLESGVLQNVSIDNNRAVLIEPFIPNPRLIVFGGGHIAKPLSEFASKVGFKVTIVDDRPFFANAERFPDAEKVICEPFEDSFKTVNFRKSDYVVIITRGHRYDGIVLREVLNYDFSYVGMIGSRRRVAAMRQELLEDGYNKDRLALVNAPIGLDISAITPEEIAVSIISQLISFKNKGIMSKFGKNFSFPEFDPEVAQKISEKTTMPKALITILSSKGSVPRKAGAKMVAYFDGTTVGSIGGGCSESGVISKARKLMLGKGFLMEHVDMTGSVAESEGMVCGGTMEVLIEVL